MKSAAPGLPACGPPPQYYPGSNLLNFAVRMGSEERGQGRRPAGENRGSKEQQDGNETWYHVATETERVFESELCALTKIRNRS
eukprot:scaffold59551_cov57-Phaeocystis_antarctica.AAC.2